MRISDWSSDVCSSDLGAADGARTDHRHEPVRAWRQGRLHRRQGLGSRAVSAETEAGSRSARRFAALKVAGRGALGAWVTAGAAEPETSAAIVKGLSAAGAVPIATGKPSPDPIARRPARPAPPLDPTT